MSQTTPALRLTNLLLTSGTRTRKDPDAVFDRLVARATRGRVPLNAEYTADLDHLRLVLRAFAGFPGLSPLGWMAGQALVESRVQNHAVVGDLHARFPEIADEPVEAPVFVVGMPRTGTTLTYNLLSRSPAHRGPKLWEMTHLGLAVDSTTEAALIRRTRKKYAMVSRLSPRWDTIHPLYAEAEEEDTFIRTHSELHASAVPVPGYVERLRTFDHRPDYRFLRDALQVLSYERPARRWVLKHPANLFHMSAIRDVFPDARFVWTHRDPEVALASLCSLAEATERLHRRPEAVDLAETGRQWLAIMSSGVSRALAQRAELGSDVVLDLPYERLTGDPGTALPELFGRLGARWGAEDQANLAAAREAPRQRAPHRYSLERYGLEPDEVQAAFADYVELLPALPHGA
ncbi:Sulfotransferase family protein [Promicromonospora umidemergens]|uniref:Sulfotransferase n=1 Tax=Promicromonospora umidemergens TaxID=629679 RepID=A0ABP8WNH4_9MICO|nr:sulfotransferase [Promicromonospora umidemergens]MCP2283236.1 Sulfotransferase family protein [Promicromonospora umidemergens]